LLNVDRSIIKVRRRSRLKEIDSEYHTGDLLNCGGARKTMRSGFESTYGNNKPLKVSRTADMREVGSDDESESLRKLERHDRIKTLDSDRTFWRLPAKVDRDVHGNN